MIYTVKYARYASVEPRAWRKRKMVYHGRENSACTRIHASVLFHRTQRALYANLSTRGGQLPTNQLHDIWGARDTWSRAPQLMSCKYYVCACCIYLNISLWLLSQSFLATVTQWQYETGINHLLVLATRSTKFC